MSTGWSAVVLVALAACSREPPPPTSLGPFQPATLSEAVLFRNRTAVENFLALGVDPNEAEYDGTTPLMRAVHASSTAIARLLIDAGADVRKANSYGVTALYLAARAGDAPATRLLLAAGADANATLPTTGETVLMTAVKAGDADVVRALLTGGSDNVSLAQIGEARAAARIAESAGYTVQASPTVGMSYAEVNVRDRLYGRTPLMMAATEGNSDIVALLIDAGSELNLLDLEGASALSLARNDGHLHIAAQLEAAGATR